jgi:hypothetical protein
VGLNFPSTAGHVLGFFYFAKLHRLQCPKTHWSLWGTLSHFRPSSLSLIVSSGHFSSKHQLHFARSLLPHSSPSLPLPDISDDILLDVNLPCVTMAPKFKDGEVVLAFSGSWVSWAHTVVAYSAHSTLEFSPSEADRDCSCFYKCLYCWRFSALSQDRPERILWVSSGMVPFRIGDDW